MSQPASPSPSSSRSTSPTSGDASRSLLSRPSVGGIPLLHKVGPDRQRCAVPMCMTIAVAATLMASLVSFGVKAQPSLFGEPTFNRSGGAPVHAAAAAAAAVAAATARQGDLPPRLRHLGRPPSSPRRGPDWLREESRAYCEHSEPRFNRGCLDRTTWGERQESLRRTLRATAAWLEQQRVDYFAMYSTLLAASAADDAMATTQQCEIGLTRAEYTRVLIMLRSGMHQGIDASLKYAGAVDEDAPWLPRTAVFPKYEGEYWAPLDEVVDAPGIGVLFKPQAVCEPLRFVDKTTGFYCEAVVVDSEERPGKEATLLVRREGGPKTCPHDGVHSRHGGEDCKSSSCYRFSASAILPTRICEGYLFGILLRCPNNVASTLKGCYSEAQLDLARRKGSRRR